MSKTLHQQRVEHFMRLAGQIVPELPCVPPEEVRLLRAKLIFEEAMETIEALGVLIYAGSSNQLDQSDCAFVSSGTPNLVEIADGCADLSVVSIGTLSACGISDEALLTEVDLSNLRKFSKGSYRRDDGKWMKPPNWTPPDIRGVLTKQQWKERAT